MKLQIIYNFYIANNECSDSVYKLHFYNLKRYSAYVDRVIIIITYDHKYNDDIVYRIKSALIDNCNCNDLQIIFEANDPINREGAIYKKYIIDKLDQYDDYLTFFGHTKGVSNKNGYDNLKNLHTWINALYFFNFYYINEMKLKLAPSDEYDYISFGSLYFKDYRHNNINNWFYSGSFYWINTYKLNKYIKDNNININNYVCAENERLKRCAELFLGFCYDETKCAFHNDQLYNKEMNHFNMYGWEISYNNIDLLIKQYLNLWEYETFCDDHASTINELSIEY